MKKLVAIEARKLEDCVKAFRVPIDKVRQRKNIEGKNCLWDNRYKYINLNMPL